MTVTITVGCSPHRYKLAHELNSREQQQAVSKQQPFFNSSCSKKFSRPKNIFHVRLLLLHHHEIHSSEHTREEEEEEIKLKPRYKWRELGLRR